LPLTTLGQETRWAYSTPPPSPHGAHRLRSQSLLQTCLSHNSNFFFTHLLCYVSLPLRIDPLSFQARCSERRLNLALVVFLCCSTFLLIGECVLFLCQVFPYKAKRLAWGGETSPFRVEWDAKPQLNRSITQLRDDTPCTTRTRSHLLSHFQPRETTRCFAQ